MRVLIIFLFIAVVLVIPFIFMGDEFESWLSGEGAVKHLRSYGAWSAIIGVMLLVSDLILPIPATAVIAGLGIVYGPLAGGLIGGLGSVLSGLTAYGACRLLGGKVALFLAGEKDLIRGRAFFERSGGWAVVLSRWAPILPEAVSSMAGLMGMPFIRFFIALVCGSFPMAMVYAYLGKSAEKAPSFAIIISAAAPVILWACVSLLFKRREKIEITN